MPGKKDMLTKRLSKHKNIGWGWRDGSVVKNTGCFSRDAGSILSIHLAAHSHQSPQFQRIRCPLLASLGTRTISDMYTFLEVKHQHT